jgi:hypothetical protein
MVLPFPCVKFVPLFAVTKQSQPQWEAVDQTSVVLPRGGRPTDPATHLDQLRSSIAARMNPVVLQAIWASDVSRQENADRECTTISRASFHAYSIHTLDASRGQPDNNSAPESFQSTRLSRIPATGSGPAHRRTACGLSPVDQPPSAALRVGRDAIPVGVGQADGFSTTGTPTRRQCGADRPHGSACGSGDPGPDGCPSRTAPAPRRRRPARRARAPGVGRGPSERLLDGA